MARVKLLFSVIVLLGLGGCGLQPAAPLAWTNSAAPHTFRFDGNSLAEARARYLTNDAATVAAVNELLAAADKALLDAPYSVTYKKGTIPGIDAHTYVSIAPYFWPNPNTPDHLPYIEKDGQRNPEFADYDAKPLMELTDHIDVLSLAAYFTQDPKYAARAELLIRTWFLEPATRMNPSMDHCQLIKGVDDGSHTGVIESRRFINAIDAIEILKTLPNSPWTSADDAGFRSWLIQFLYWLGQGKVAVIEGDSKNNHGTWYDVQVVTYHLYLDDLEGARAILGNDKQKRIWVQIEPDGKQLAELARTKAFWYSEFNLNALAQLANLGRLAGIDLWNYQAPSGPSIQKAIDWLIPYAVGDKPWTYSQIQGLSAKELLPVLRLAGSAYHTKQYEAAIPKLQGQDVLTDNDYEHPLLPRSIYPLLYPPPQ